MPLSYVILMRSTIQPLQRLFDMSTSDKSAPLRKVRHEGMRIGGEVVFTDHVIEVPYPYIDECIGTVPAGKTEHVAKAFEIAAA